MNITLTYGYDTYSTNPFTMLGTTASADWSLSSNWSQVTLDEATNKIVIASGLGLGVYPVTLNLENSCGNDSINIQIIVIAATTRQVQLNKISTVSGMLTQQYNAGGDDVSQFVVNFYNTNAPSVVAYTAILNEANGWRHSIPAVAQGIYRIEEVMPVDNNTNTSGSWRLENIISNDPPRWNFTEKLLTINSLSPSPPAIPAIELNIENFFNETPIPDEIDFIGKYSIYASSSIDFQGNMDINVNTIGAGRGVSFASQDTNRKMSFDLELGYNNNIAGRYTHKGGGLTSGTITMYRTTEPNYTIENSIAYSSPRPEQGPTTFPTSSFTQSNFINGFIDRPPVNGHGANRPFRHAAIDMNFDMNMTVTPGDVSVFIPINQTSTLNPGNYSTLVAENNTTINLRPGRYNFSSINTGTGVRIYAIDNTITGEALSFLSPVQVLVKGKITLSNSNRIGAGERDTPNLFFMYSDYISATDQDYAIIVNAGTGYLIDCFFIAPNGSVMCHNEGIFRGRLYAKNLYVAASAKLGYPNWYPITTVI